MHFFSEGLRKSLFNYMHGVGFDIPLRDWFDIKVPPTSIPKKYIERQIQGEATPSYRDQNRIIWIGSPPELMETEEGICELIFFREKRRLRH